jgi:hypothetical protein
MPTLSIYPPHGEENPYGHVALKTDKYYISFWTAQVLQSDENEENQAKRSKRKLINALDALGVLKGHQGGLVIHQDLDQEYEGNCNPNEYEISAVVSNEDVNSVYEDFLRYNGIDPEEVTLSKSDEIFKKRREYEASLSAEEAKKVLEEPQLPQKSLPKTQYSFSVELVSEKEDESLLPFYHKQQSCVSFLFNLIQTAWLRHYPDQPIPIVFKTVGVLIVPNITRNNESGDVGEYAYDVPWFQEQVVEKFLVNAEILLQNPATTALNISLGVLTRPFKVFFPAIFGISFLCWYFSWLFGLPVKVIIFYRYGFELESIFRVDRDLKVIREILSIRSNFWVLFYIMVSHQFSIVLLLFQIWDMLSFLLGNTCIEFTCFVVSLVFNIVLALEEKLSIIRETKRALMPLKYFVLVWIKISPILWNEIRFS